MKKHILEYSHLICSLFLCLLACVCNGCTEEPLQEDGRAVIRLGAKSPTRAVNSLEDLSAAGNNVGIYGIQISDASSGIPSDGSQWGGVLRMDNVRTTSIDALTGNISWAGNYYYPAEEESSVEFCAYHPYAPGGTSSDGRFFVEAPASGHAPVLHFSLSGREDVMFATPVTGSRNSRPQGLEFRHVLTQLRFQVIDSYASLNEVSLRGISLLGVNSDSSMNIETGALGAWSSPGELAVPGITEVLITGSPTQPQSVGQEVMLEPGQPEFHVRVETSKATYDDVLIRPTSSIGGVKEESFAAGRSYLITLSFQQQTGIVLSATVVPWVMAGYGSAIVQ